MLTGQMQPQMPILPADGRQRSMGRARRRSRRAGHSAATTHNGTRSSVLVPAKAGGWGDVGTSCHTSCISVEDVKYAIANGVLSAMAGFTTEPYRGKGQ